MRALGEGWRSYLADPEPINAIMAEGNRDMSVEVMNASAAKLSRFVENADTDDRGLGAMTGERWGRLVRQMTELGLLEGPTNTAEVFVSPRDQLSP